MDRERLKEFTFRVTQASRTELVVIMYDVILSDTKVAREALAKGDIEGYERELKMLSIAHNRSFHILRSNFLKCSPKP